MIKRQEITEQISNALSKAETDDIVPILASVICRYNSFQIERLLRFIGNGHTTAEKKMFIAALLETINN